MVTRDGKDVPWSSDWWLDTYGELVINITTSSGTPKKIEISKSSSLHALPQPFTQGSLGNGKGTVNTSSLSGSTYCHCPQLPKAAWPL